MKNPFKIIFTITICLCLTTLFSTCKKYPEDGKRSWHKPVKRLTAGTWILKEYLVDGDDSTNKWYYYYNSSLFDTIKWKLADMEYYFRVSDKKSTDYRNTISSEYTMKYFHALNLQGNSINNFHNYGEWQLKNKNKLIDFNTTYLNENVYCSILGTNVAELWEIRKLTDKEFIVESNNVLNKKIRLKFQK
jgi:hypothetical protein